MTLVSPTQVSDGTTADAADINTPVNQLAAVINGNIDNSNIVSGAAIDGAKLAANSIDIGAKASTWDGWIAVSDTWTYASATTVTVPSDATAKYSVGDKVKFTNSGAKFFYITAVTGTILTLNGGSDYTVANAAITVPYYSKAETPVGFPQWFNYTPTFANTTLGNGTVTGRFSMSGKTVNFRAAFGLGSTSAVGAGGITVSFPLASVSTYTINDSIGGTSSTITSLYTGTLCWTTSTTGGFLVLNTAGTYGISSFATTAVPASWTTGSAAQCYGTYQAA